MRLPRAESTVERLVVVEESGSTNDDLIAASASEPDFSVLVTDSQTAGRGRLGREWIAPPGKTLAVSVLLRPVLPAGEPLGVEHFGWLPLIAGVAMARAVQSIVPPHRVGLKWPNDVQVDGQKISGILAELLPTGDGVVMGSGLNISLAADELPTPTSTSLLLSGAALEGDELADAALTAYLGELRALYSEFVRLGGDADGSGIRDTVVDACSTLGQQVRVQLPGGDDLLGTATGIDRTGRLEVRRSADGRSQAVAAGDVTHLRYE